MYLGGGATCFSRLRVGPWTFKCLDEDGLKKSNTSTIMASMLTI